MTKKPMKAKKPTAKKSGRSKGKMGTAFANVELSKDEIAERADQLATLLQKIDEQKDALKAHAKNERDEIKGDEQQARKLGDAVLTHTEDREVDVEFVVQGDQLVTTRVDTGEVLATRLATDKDKQEDLFAGT